MPPTKKSTIPLETIALYDKLIATNPAIERKGANNPYTALNGNMFTLLNPPNGDLAIRLSADDREQFLKKYKTKLFEAYGVVMKEYVAVPKSLLAKTSELAKYLNLSYAYAKTLKPKPSKITAAHI
jgi:TfoX/Sxy family transcriptional regulator of competence genes